MITLEICQKQPFDIIAMTPRGTLGLCCVHIAQLMAHPAVYTLPFTLQLCYKLLGILQRVTKSQKFHISSHDVLQKSHTCHTQMTIMMYGSRYIKHDRQMFLLFWAIFCPFAPVTIQKIKILKKWKKFL